MADHDATASVPPAALRPLPLPDGCCAAQDLRRAATSTVTDLPDSSLRTSPAFRTARWQSVLGAMPMRSASARIRARIS